MAEVKSLLSPNATQLERVLEQAIARLGAVPLRLRHNWNARTCPLHLLPWLAASLGVVEWDNAWPPAYQREVVATIREIRRKQGTPGAVLRALAALGHPNARLIERKASIRRDGRARYNGTHTRGGNDNWASFSVVLTRPVSIKQGTLIRQRIHSVKRNCCHLLALDFSSTPNRRDGTIRRDRTFTYGTV